MTDDEPLDVTPRLVPYIKGGRTKPISVALVGPLTDEDLAMLSAARGTRPVHVQRLRDSHHRLARCLATGMTHVQASMQTGYSQKRVSDLLTDPSFQDLVTIYRKAGSETYHEYADIAMGNLIRGERLIEDALEAAGEKEEPLELSQLRPVLDIVSDRSDRFGYPKAAVNHNVTHDLAGRLESARRRAGLIVDATPVEAGNAESDDTARGINLARRDSGR